MFFKYFRYIKLIIAYFGVSIIFYNCQNVVNEKYNNQKITTNIDSTIKKEGPILSMDTYNYDFGKVKKKKLKIIPIKLNLKNDGNMPLILYKIDVSCNCMSVKSVKNIISPGEQQKIYININTKNEKGIFNKAVFIRSNALNELELIRIKGIIK